MTINHPGARETVDHPWTDRIALHDVADCRRIDGADGLRLQRVPESVRRHLNDGARDVVQEADGTEIRCALTDGDESGSVTLSAPEGAVAVPYWGPFRERVRYDLGPEPTTIDVERPEFFDRLDPDLRAECAFDPSVCRLLLRGGPVHVHDATGAIRPPRADELPGERLLSYGTSITQGHAATGPHLTYPAQVARRLGTDHVNLGSSGTAYCEPELADWIGDRDDWDLATLSLSVNMYGAFDLPTFRDRISYFIETVAGENPGKPVVAITLFPFHPDVLADPDDSDVDGTVEDWRQALRDAVEAAELDNLHLLEGRDLLDPQGLTTDLIHPADDGMVRIGERLAAFLERLESDG